MRVDCWLQIFPRVDVLQIFIGTAKEENIESINTSRDKNLIWTDLKPALAFITLFVIYISSQHLQRRGSNFRSF